MKRNVQTFFQRATLKYSGLCIVLLTIVSLSVSFLIAREQSKTDLEETAKAVAHAFNDRILDGDIRSVEPQIREVLHIKSDEYALILKSDFTRVYEPIGEESIRIEPCPKVGETCFNKYLGRATIVFPISLSAEATPYRYLYIAKNVHFNWPFFVTVLTIFTLGYLGLVGVYLRISKIVSGRLGAEIENWSKRLVENPKDTTPLSNPPFEELLPLKFSIEGLNPQIAQYEKEATDKAKLLVLRGIAHDILSPVSRLQLYVATLEASANGEQNKELVAEIKEASKNIASVASQVKSLQESVATNVSTELVSAISEELESLKHLECVTAKNLSLNYETKCTNLPATLSRIELSRILTNLVQNAADASKDGSDVIVGLREDKNELIVTVTDSGCGIPENAQARVFDPDFTLKPRTGTGLGLTIVKYICDLRKGKIELDSRVNKGTKVSIRFPKMTGDAYV